MTYFYLNDLTIIVSDNGLSLSQLQAIIWTNAGILSIQTLRTNFGELSSEIHTFSFTKKHFKMLSAKWCQFCLGLNVLKVILPNIEYIYVGKAARYKIGCVFPGQHQRPHLSVLERLPLNLQSMVGEVSALLYDILSSKPGVHLNFSSMGVCISTHDGVIKWKHFPRYWPFVWGMTCEFPAQRSVTQSFDVFFDLHLNNRLSKQSRRQWFKMSWCSLWCHSYESICWGWKKKSSLYNTMMSHDCQGVSDHWQLHSLFKSLLRLIQETKHPGWGLLKLRSLISP